MLALVSSCNAASGAVDGALTDVPATPADHDAPVPAKPDAASTEKACDAPPAGMVCVAGGPAVVGTDDLSPAEKPKHTVEVPTFYLDQYEVTNAQFHACEQAGICPQRSGYPKNYLSFMQPQQPAVPITWVMAHAYCVWAGKRLPSEAEWEKAARGPEGHTYPWGNEPPSCERAHYKGCPPPLTRAVGSFAPGAYGLFDMAGNGFEWVNDWASECYGGCEHACGEACLAADPRGPCAGAPRCEGMTKRVLKGGSWYWPESELLPAKRRAERPVSGLHRMSFRCAASTPQLTSLPPRALSDAPPAPVDPQPPSPDELAAFRAVHEDHDIMTLTPCNRVGKATLNCRDPMSYIKTNEALQPLWQPYIKNVGGGYVGIGSDQNYHFIVAAKSRWAWIFDYDPTVVRVHYLIRAVVLAKETPEEFAAAFQPRNLNATRALVAASLAADAAEAHDTDELLREIHGALAYHYHLSLKPRPRFPDFGWLSDVARYRYIRLMFQQGRIEIMKGNMLTDVAMPSIAESAKKLGVVVRVYYPSNAESQWPRLTEQYRSNVRALPFDERSVILRTLLGTAWNDDDDEQRWHYVVQAGLHCQEWFKFYDRVSLFMSERLPTATPELSTIRLPGGPVSKPTAELGQAP